MGWEDKLRIAFGIKKEEIVGAKKEGAI